MKRGISPIVAVVLLIAIAVIAAVGLYFWVGSLTGKQATPNVPNMIAAQAICGDDNSTVLITNIGTSALPSSVTLHVVYPNGTDISWSGCDVSNLASGNTTQCTLNNFGKGDGTATIYGDNIGAISVHC